MKPLIKFFYTLSGLLSTAYNLVLFKYKKIAFGSFPLIHGKIYIKGSGKIKLGKDVIFISSKTSNAIGGDTRTVINTSIGAVLTIGDNTGISNCTIICQNQIDIGSYVKIGGSVKIYDTDFHSIDYMKRANMTTDIPVTKPIIIEDYCFIGAHSIILKGVTIGAKSIVGAGSVVAKSIPCGEIWGGNPAKFIKKIPQ